MRYYKIIGGDNSNQLASNDLLIRIASENFTKNTYKLIKTIKERSCMNPDIVLDYFTPYTTAEEGEYNLILSDWMIIISSTLKWSVLISEKMFDVCIKYWNNNCLEYYRATLKHNSQELPYYLILFRKEHIDLVFNFNSAKFMVKSFSDDTYNVEYDLNCSNFRDYIENVNSLFLNNNDHLLYIDLIKLRLSVKLFAFLDTSIWIVSEDLYEELKFIDLVGMNFVPFDRVR